MKLPTWALALGSAAILGAAAVAFYTFTGRSDQAGDSIALRPGDASVVAAGATIYRDHCAACHGVRLEGQADWRTRGADGLMPAPPHDASGHTWHHRDEVLFRITKLGVAAAIGQPDYKTAMPVYANTLSDADIVAVLSWIKAQWPAAVRDKHDQINAQPAPTR